MAPPGSALVELLGRGACFAVSLVQLGGELLIAKRPVHLTEVHPFPPIQREREALAALDHPGIPKLVAAGTDSFGSYVVEQRMLGRPIHLAAAELDLGARTALVQRAVQLVAHVHEAEDARGKLGIVHGDLGPQAFLADERGQVSLIDFSAAGLGPERPAIGRGTLPFAAPELCRGESPPTHTTDRYAVALLVVQVLCGERLCPPLPEPALLVSLGERGHDLAALARAHEIPTVVRAELERLLAFDPSRRSTSLTPLLAALEAARQEGSGGVSSGP